MTTAATLIPFQFNDLLFFLQHKQEMKSPDLFCMTASQTDSMYGGECKNVRYQGETCMCAFTINVSASVHSTGPIRGRSSAVCCLVASNQQKKHAQIESAEEPKPPLNKIQIISPSAILWNNLSRSGTIIRKEAR